MKEEKKLNEVIPADPPKPKSKFKLFLAWIILGLALLYGISPFDIIPDYLIAGVGWLDDIVIIGTALYNLIKRIRESRK